MAGNGKIKTVRDGEKAKVLSGTTKNGSGGVFLLGLLITFIGLIKLSADGEKADNAVKTIGWGLFIAFCGPMVPLHVLIVKSKEAFKVKAIYSVMTLALYGLATNSLLVGIFGEQIICQPWSPIYDPDSGSCPCDKRDLLSTTDAPQFTSRQTFSLPGTIKIATIGDTTMKEGKIAMELAKSKGIDLFVVNGDLTYAADPEGFDRTLSEVFGENFPVFVTVGNHDTGIYTEYQEVVQDRYERYRQSVAGLDPLTTLLCDGMIGVNSKCSFFNMALFFNGLGSSCSNDDFLNEDLSEGLAAADSQDVVWRLVYIHKNQRLLQTGGKRDEVGVEAFENSLRYGAYVLNSHEHTYARTKELYGVGLKADDFVFREEADVLDGKEVINLGANSFGVVANGLGGKSIRDVEAGLDKNPWWASTFHDASEGINYGVHVCEYGINGEGNLAYCYFETLDGLIVDEYYLRSNN